MVQCGGVQCHGGATTVTGHCIFCLWVYVFSFSLLHFHDLLWFVCIFTAGEQKLQKKWEIMLSSQHFLWAFPPFLLRMSLKCYYHAYFSYIHTFRHYLFPLFVNIAIDINIIIRIITNVTYVSLIATVTITIYCHYYINYHLYHYGYYF